MRGIAFVPASIVVLAGACGATMAPPPPGPVVSSMTPQTGDWGTEVTIDGQNFGGQGTVVFAGSVGANGFVVDTWSDTEIRGRVAFPATGAVSIQNAAGGGPAGTFTTTMPWVPIGPLDAVDAFDGLVTSTGTVTALERRYQLTDVVGLAVFGGSATGAYALAGVGSSATSGTGVAARLVEADDHTPQVIATLATGSVASFGFSQSSLGTAPSSLSGAVLAAVRDQTGVLTWVATSTGMSRVRPGMSWTVDRGPIALVTAGDTPLAGAVAGDGTLWVAVAHAGSGGTSLAIETLGPSATAFAAPEQVNPTAYAGTLTDARVSVGSDGVHALVEATLVAAGSTTVVTPRLRTAAGTWSDAPAVTGVVQYAFIGSTLAAITNDPSAKTTSLVADATMPTSAAVIPVWPMQTDAFIVDTAGTPHALVTNGDVSYSLTPAP